MKTSELIRRLQELVAEHGDVDSMVDGCCDPYPQYVERGYNAPYIEL